MSCWHFMEHSLYKDGTNLMVTGTDLSSVLTNESGSLRTQAH